MISSLAHSVIYLESITLVPRGPPSLIGSTQCCRGLEKTKDGVVARELERLTQATTFQQVQRQVEEAYMAIDQLDIFETINIEIDANEVPFFQCPHGLQDSLRPSTQSWMLM